MSTQNLSEPKQNNATLDGLLVITLLCYFTFEHVLLPTMKYKQRIYLAFVATNIVLIILFLVNYRRETRIVNGSDIIFSDRQRVHISPRRRKLNKSNISSDIVLSKPPEEESDWIEISTNNSLGQFSYFDPEVDLLLPKLHNSNNIAFNFTALEQILFEDLVESFDRKIKNKKYLPAFRNRKQSPKEKNWQAFQRHIHQTALYDPHDVNIDGLLKDLTFEPIVATELKDGGTQIKLVITFQNGGQALFKPMRFPRDVETLPDHFYFDDYERHNAEIAAFHLDWVMGFYRVPPTCGRKVNMISEIKNVANAHLKRKFYISPADNVCFYGDCSYYCDTTHGVCGKPDMLEGSFAVFLPQDDVADRVTWRNPWRRSYNKKKKAYWEKNNDLCAIVKQEPIFRVGRRLVEIIDMHIFDFLTGNMDRHHYETFHDFGNDTFLLHYDNGRAFGKSKHDEMSILAPLYQCCHISYATFIKLVKLYIGPQRLSDLMRKSLSNDSVNPILTESHLLALDRRVIKILKEVLKCVKYNNVNDVIIDPKW